MRTVGAFVRRNSFWAGYFPGVIAVSFSGLLFSQLYLIREEWSTYYLLTTTNFLLLTMCYISFYQSIYIKNSLPDHLPAPRLRHHLRHNHPLFTEIKKCEKENEKYKPARTSHCKRDGCVVRMDHHCPYINNCLGLCNLKAFLLFNFYGGIFAAQFFNVSLYNYYEMVTSGENRLTQAQITIWIILVGFSFLLTMGMNGLWITNLLKIMTNITQLDTMKGQFRWRDREGICPNPYDLGTITNFAVLFEGHLWTFWWPSKIVPKCDGASYPMQAPIEDEQIKTLFQQVQDLVKDPLEKSLPSTVEELYEREKENYKNTIFFFLGEQFTLEDQEPIQKQFARRVNKEEVRPVDVLGSEQRLEKEDDEGERLFEKDQRLPLEAMGGKQEEGDAEGTGDAAEEAGEEKEHSLDGDGDD